ncbi:MAG: dienelactone hydrolase [Gammaproteobacteria bacterium]|nr:dienelactone hydrolase [Gammaproteobacteria bacterium]
MNTITQISTTAILMMTLSINATAQSDFKSNRIDIVRPDAPELSAFGDYAIGVRTLELLDAGRVDVVNTQPGADNVIHDRSLTVEVWYPAQLAEGQQPGGEYSTETRNLEVIATLHGSAVRDAAPLSGEGNFPLVILSHGYPGNRFLMSHLGENLASKGYVVASIDHTDSTYQNQQPIASTLYNRAKDQRFVLQKMAEMSAAASGFLSGLVDADNTALIGFSMGGYGLLNNLGGSYNEAMIDGAISPPNQLLRELTAANPQFLDNLDPRIKAGVAIAPWGMNSNFFNADVLKGVMVPTFYVAGSVDATAGYENGTRGIFESAVNSDRHLLTFINGGHSVAAPIPVPVEILNTPDGNGAGHYMDAVWDTVRSNNILAHFATAFLDLHLKGDQSRAAFLNLIPDPAQGVYAMNQGEPTAQHTYWKGFSRGSAVGMTLEHRKAGQ